MIELLIRAQIPEWAEEIDYSSPPAPACRTRRRQAAAALRRQDLAGPLLRCEDRLRAPSGVPGPAGAANGPPDHRLHRPRSPGTSPGRQGLGARRARLGRGVPGIAPWRPTVERTDPSAGPVSRLRPGHIPCSLAKAAGSSSADTARPSADGAGDGGPVHGSSNAGRVGGAAPGGRTMRRRGLRPVLDPGGHGNVTFEGDVQ